MDPRSALLLWGTGCLLLGLLITWLLIRGEFRMLTLVLLGFLGLVSLSLKRGVYILTAFLPFMYFIRRSVLNFQDFSQRDPILLFPALTTAAIWIGVVVFYGPTLLYYIRRSALLRAALLLMGVFVLQIFNPLQGNVLVGVAGALYFIIPMMWLPFGVVLGRNDVRIVLKMVVVIGLITALYGLKQHYFGLSDVEIYELRSKNFFKYFGNERDVRVMSTFAGLVDFARYLSLAGFLAFAFFWRKKNALPLLFVLGLVLWAMLFTASRTAFFVMIFSIFMLLILAGATARQVVVRGLLALVVVVGVYGLLSRNDPQRMYRQDFSANPFVVHTLSGMTHPTEESSFHTRLVAWAGITRNALTRLPFGPVGHGLGSTTAAASKFEGGQYFEADSYFFEIMYGSGLAATACFLAVMLFLLTGLGTMCLENPHAYIYRIAFGLLCGYLLSSVFGVALRDTICAPLGWLMIGWVAKEHVDLKEARSEEASS